jgi:Lon protease-like protein
MEFDSPKEITQLPIFPLNTVLFPGAILPLHIFEDRYKQMIRFAVDNAGMFGLSYSGEAAVDRETLPEIGSVGCVARINTVVPLEEGRMNLLSTGLIRYRVRGLEQTQPFIIASVETFTDDLEAGAELNQLFDDLVDLCARFVETAQALDEMNAPESIEFPDEPEAFSLIISSLLPITNDAKQSLLEMTSTRSRLMRIKHFLSLSLPGYEQRLKIREMAKQNGHGRLHSK